MGISYLGGVGELATIIGLGVNLGWVGLPLVVGRWSFLVRDPCLFYFYF